MKLKRVIYFTTLFVVFIGAYSFYAHFPFPDENTTAFHFNTAVVTWRVVVNVLVFIGLAALYIISARNFLVAIDVKHTTVIQKK